VRVGVCGSVLVVLGGVAAGGAVFLRDGAQMKKAEAARDAGLAAFDQGELDEAAAELEDALEAALLVGGATGRRPAALEVLDESRRWLVALDALRAVEAEPGEALALLEPEGTVLGRELPPGLAEQVARARAHRLLETGLALEARGAVEPATQVLEEAAEACAAAGSERVAEAEAALARAGLRRDLAAAESAAARKEDAEARRLADAADAAIAGADGLTAAEAAALEARLARVRAEVADREALASFASVVAGLRARVPTNDLGDLHEEVAAVAPPALRGDHPAAEEQGRELERLQEQLEAVRAVARDFRGMVLAVDRAGAPVYIDRTEVTNADYLAFVEAGGYAERAHWSEEGWGVRERMIDRSGEPGPQDWRDQRYPDGAGDLPVTGVRFFEAEAYAAWAGKRLPTFAEWKAAAVGTSSRPFPWGSEWRPGAANLATSHERGALEPVGSYPSGVGPTGALDLIGNAREIVRHEGGHVAAGGSFRVAPAQATVDRTREVSRLLRSSDTGFRCAKELRWDG